MFHVIQEKRLTLREMFSLAGEVLQRKGTLIVGISTVIYIVYGIFNYLTTDLDPTNSFILPHIISLIFAILVGNLAPLVIITITYQVIQEQELDFKAISTTVFKNLLSGVWINILMGIIVVIAALAFIIPGIIVAIFYAFSLQAMIIHNKRGYAALEYSWDVVKGDWGKVFVVFVLNLATIFGITYFLGHLVPLDQVTLFILEIGVSVIGGLFAIVEVVMFLNFDTFKKRVVHPDESDDDTVLI